MPGACPAQNARLPSYLTCKAPESRRQRPNKVNLSKTDESQGRLDFLSPLLAGFLPAPSSPTQSADTHLQSLKEHSAPTERPRMPRIAPCFLFLGFCQGFTYSQLWAPGLGSVPTTFSVPLPHVQALQIFAKTPPRQAYPTLTDLGVQPPSEFYTLTTISSHTHTHSSSLCYPILTDLHPVTF